MCASDMLETADTFNVMHITKATRKQTQITESGPGHKAKRYQAE